MKKLILLWFTAAVVAFGQQVTPNIGLLIQTPPQYANNWGAITNYNFQKIDTAFAGVGSQWRGAWSSVTAYTAGNFVSYLGNYYLAIQNSTNQNPVTQTAYWVEVNGSGGCTGVSPGSYTNTNLTVNSVGCVTAASNGSGGSGGIVPPNPSNTTYAILTDSRGLSSTTSGIAIPAATAAVCGSGICIITAPNNFKAGDWVGFCCSGFSPSALVGNPYYAQILSAGLSSTQFEIASSVTGSGTGGPLLNASYNWPLAMADPNILPNSYFYGHGTVLDYNPTSGETIANLISFYNANVHSISPVITSNPGYLFIHAGYDDYIINGGCSTSSALAMEPQFQQFWAIAHQDGWKVAQLTNPANSISSGVSCNAQSFYLGWSITNEWMKAQGKSGYVAATLGTASASSTSLAITDGTTTALYQAIVATGVPDNTYITACSPACGTAGAMTLTLSQATTSPLSSTSVYLRNQWWDYLIDAASELNDITQNLTQPTNGPHYSDQGNQLIAQLANATFISGNLQLKNQAGNGDSAPNLGKNNWWIPQTTGGMIQQIQIPSGNTQTGGWETFAAGYNNCIGIGFDGGDSDPSIYFANGNICGGGNNYPVLNWRVVSDAVEMYMPKNVDLAWNAAFGQAAPDTNLSRDSAGVIDVGNGTHNDKSGAMKMASLFLGIASDPGSPSNGQLWYNSTSNLLKAYINGATVALGSGGGTAPSATFSIATGAAASPAAPYVLAPASGTVSDCYWTTLTSDGSTNLVFNVKFNGTNILSGTNATVTAGDTPGSSHTFSLTSGTISITQGQKWELDISTGATDWTGAVQCY